MPTYITIFNQTLAMGTILIHIFLCVLLFSFAWNPRRSNKFLIFVDKYAIEASLAIASVAMLTSLVYSEIIGFPPCELCWVQRSFIYPQVLLFAIMLWKNKVNKNRLMKASIVLSSFGAIVSLYHVYIEHGGSSSLPCVDPSSATVSCAIRYVYEFGYISMPVMAFTTSITILILLVIHRTLSRSR
jgi:disulfide bond formation protein DsbB